MPVFSKEEELPYTTSELFKLVSNIEEYPYFIPWCKEAVILERDGDIVLADLIINYFGIKGKYTSKVFLDEKNQEISVELAQGPFEYLYQSWKFIKISEKSSIVEFDIDFKLRSFILNKILSPVFSEVCVNIVYAFKDRARKLYGNRKS